MDGYRDEKETLRRRVVALERQLEELTDDDVDAAEELQRLRVRVAELEVSQDRYRRRALEAEAALAAHRASEEPTKPSGGRLPSGIPHAIAAIGLLLAAAVLGSVVRGGGLLAACALLASLILALRGSALSKRAHRQSESQVRVRVDADEPIAADEHEVSSARPKRGKRKHR